MRQIQIDGTNKSVDVYIIDSTTGLPETGVLFNTSGIDLEYRREGAAAVNVTEVTLAALTTAHTDGGFLEIGHGYYRFDLPDAAFATGALSVSIQGTVTGMIVLPQTIQLVAFDPDDAVRLGLTALPNAAADAAGGLAISDAGGLDLDANIAQTGDSFALANGAAGFAAIDTVVDAILVDTGTTIPATIVTAQNDLDIITGASGVNLLTATQTSIDAIEADTNELQADDIPTTLATIAGYLDTEIAAILVDTGTTIPAQISALDAVVDTVKAETVLILADTNELQTDDVPTLIANLDSVVDTVKAETVLILADTNELQSDDIPSLIATVGANVDIMVAGIINGAAATGTLSTTVATTNLTGYADEQLIGRIITVLSGAAEGESSDITDYALTNGQLTFTAMTVAMSNADTFKIT